MSTDSVTNEVVLFGAGMELLEGEAAQLSQRGVERVDRFVEYYEQHTDAFKSKDARIIATGGYGLLAGGVERPEDPTAREGILTADALVRKGVPHSLIMVEDTSTSSIRNLTDSIEREGGAFFDPADYQGDRRLGGVSHPKHLKRIGSVIIPRLGIPRENFVRIATHQKDEAIREFVLRNGYRLLLLGAHGPVELAKRELLPEVMLGKLRGTGR